MSMLKAPDLFAGDPGIGRVSDRVSYLADPLAELLLCTKALKLEINDLTSNLAGGLGLQIQKAVVAVMPDLLDATMKRMEDRLAKTLDYRLGAAFASAFQPVQEIMSTSMALMQRLGDSGRRPGTPRGPFESALREADRGYPLSTARSPEAALAINSVEQELKQIQQQQKELVIKLETWMGWHHAKLDEQTRIFEQGLELQHMKLEMQLNRTLGAQFEEKLQEQNVEITNQFYEWSGLVRVSMEPGIALARLADEHRRDVERFVREEARLALRNQVADKLRLNLLQSQGDIETSKRELAAASTHSDEMADSVIQDLAAPADVGRYRGSDYHSHSRTEADRLTQLRNAAQERSMAASPVAPPTVEQRLMQEQLQYEHRMSVEQRLEDDIEIAKTPAEVEKDISDRKKLLDQIKGNLQELDSSIYRFHSSADANPQPSITTNRASPQNRPEQLQQPVEVRNLRVVIEGLRLTGAETTTPFLADMYCLCQVRGKPNIQFRTEVQTVELPAVGARQAPVWNHEGEIARFSSGDMLEFHVYDENPTNQDFIGSASLQSSRLGSNGSFSGSLALAPVQVGPAGAHSWQAALTVHVTPVRASSSAVPATASDATSGLTHATRPAKIIF